jgi:hypothetical protein
VTNDIEYYQYLVSIGQLPPIEELLQRDLKKRLKAMHQGDVQRAKRARRMERAEQEKRKQQGIGYFTR